MKKTLLAIFLCAAITPLFADGYGSRKLNIDIYPNPKFAMYGDSGLMSSTVSSMRGNTISGTNSLIQSECATIADWFLPYVYQTRKAEMEGRLSSIEASSNILRGAVNTMQSISEGTPFPLGVDSYRTLDTLVNEQLKLGSSESNAVRYAKNICVHELNPGKYRLLFSSFPKTGGSFTPDLTGLDDSRKSHGAILPLISLTAPENSTFMSPRDLDRFKLSAQEIMVIHALIANDIKTNLENQGKDNWITYKYLVDRKRDDFNRFLRNGGANEDYLVLILSVKVMNNITYFSENNTEITDAFLNSALDKVQALSPEEFTNNLNAALSR
ncbi:hypothetical protein A7P85_04400 [Eikenella corrodens]|uniref:Uncharacterized protein n=2 Tax=Eikenella corrodens TaxID=539 RepID=A0A1A9RF93_EIKCO|nr:hypothetical protein A7P85_04400 [Eikenella corrodens]